MKKKNTRNIQKEKQQFTWAAAPEAKAWCQEEPDDDDGWRPERYSQCPGRRCTMPRGSGVWCTTPGEKKNNNKIKWKKESPEHKNKIVKTTIYLSSSAGGQGLMPGSTPGGAGRWWLTPERCPGGRQRPGGSGVWCTTPEKRKTIRK